MLSFLEKFFFSAVQFQEIFVVKKSSVLGGFILSALFLTFNLFGQTHSTKIVPGGKTSAVVKPPPAALTTDKIDQDVSEALTLIQDNHVNGNKLDYNEVFKTTMDSMLHTLDPHSNYFDAKETEEFNTDQSSRYYGVGATISDLSDPQGKVIGTFIKATFENAPANRAGLRYGDKIVDINGASMLGKDRSQVSSILRGPRGTLAKVTVERYGTGKLETLEIVRDAVSQPSIPEAYMIRPGIGYIAMSGGFNRTTSEEFAEALRNLKSQGMQQLVIDLRNNGGGLVREAFNVAKTFLSNGQLVYTQKGRLNGTAETRMSDNPSPDKTPLVVLVNQNTASASEILTGALQDHDRALVVGVNTFGKGLVQIPFPLDYGSMLLLTIAKYTTPSGRLIQRDYSNGNLYDYYNRGGSLSDDQTAPKPTGAESRTDSGRPVYGGNGITPDVYVKPDTLTAEEFRRESKLLDPIFAYALNVVYGKTSGFDTYRVDRPIAYDYDIKDKDFPLSDQIFADFKKFAVDKYKISPALVDSQRKFVERLLRTEFVTAAYGSTTSNQVLHQFDNQLMKAIDVLPQAKQLALDGARTKSPSNN